MVITQSDVKTSPETMIDPQEIRQIVSERGNICVYLLYLKLNFYHKSNLTHIRKERLFYGKEKALLVTKYEMVLTGTCFKILYKPNSPTNTYAITHFLVLFIEIRLQYDLFNHSPFAALKYSVQNWDFYLEW